MATELPQEIWDTVLSFLPLKDAFRAKAVCKKWNQRPLNIFHLDVLEAVANYNRLMWPRIITTLLKNLPMIDSLVLPRAYDPKEETKTIRSLRFLTKIVCSMESSLKWAKLCTRVVDLSLDLDEARGQKKAFLQSWKILKGMTQLKRLTLKKYRLEDCKTERITLLIQLTYLQIIGKVTDAFLNRGFHSMTNLQVVKINDCILKPELALTSLTTDLRKLHLNAIDLRYTTMKFLAKCTNLKSLAVSHINTPQHIDTLPLSLQKLKICKLQHEIENTLRSLSNVHNLRSLSLRLVPFKFLDARLSLKPEEYERLGELWQLTRLSFEGSRMDTVAILNVCTSLTNIIALSLANVNLKDSELVPLVHYTQLPELDLSKNDALTMEGLRTTLRPLTSLKILNLTNIPNITTQHVSFSELPLHTLVRISL